jgi:hypothetical protein
MQRPCAEGKAESKERLDQLIAPWQQCGSNRAQDRPERKRIPGLHRAGFLLYLSHIPGPARTRPDMLTRIVAPKVAGSSPVGHPLGKA